MSKMTSFQEIEDLKAELRSKDVECQRRFWQIKDLKAQLTSKEDELFTLNQSRSKENATLKTKLNPKVDPPPPNQMQAGTQNRSQEIEDLKAQLRSKEVECQRRSKENEELKAKVAQAFQRGQQQNFKRGQSSIFVDDKTALDPVLRRFQILKETPRIASLVGQGAASENVQRIQNDIIAKNKEAPEQLCAFVNQLTTAYTATIEERLATEGMFRQCYEVIASGNSNFSDVYAAVWHLIEVADGEGIKSYLNAVTRMKAETNTAPTGTISQPTTDATTLYMDAAVVKPSFDAFLTTMVEPLGPSVQLTIPASLKAISRVVEKAALRHTDSGNCSGVCDVVRAMIVVDSMTCVGQVLDALKTMVSDTENIRIVRFKERFRHSPSAGGWRDAMVNIELKVNGVTHIAELQLVHQQMLTARKGLPGHAVYNRVRNAMELLEKRYGNVPAADMLALAALHTATGGGKVLGVEGDQSSHTIFHEETNELWHRSHKSGVEQFLADKGWLTDAPLAEWHSVTVDNADGQATRIELRNMGLSGTIPPEVANMKQVEFIDLSNNEDLEFPRGTPMDSLTGEPIYHTKAQAQHFLEFIGMSHFDQSVMITNQKLVTKHGPDGPALKRIYNDTHGSTWNMSKNLWFTNEADVSKWGGVTTDEHKQVIDLKIMHENLTALSDSIGDLKSLTSLYLQECSNLTVLPDSIGELKSLASLNLERCTNLTSLPDSIGELTSLTSLDLGWCKNLTTLPDSIVKLKSLSSLTLNQCENLTTLPDSIGELTSLASLNLQSCKKLTRLPDSISDLTLLTLLNLSACSNLTTLPDVIGGLKSLVSLDLEWCKNLTRLPDWIGELKSLTSLNLFVCSNLTTLPDSIGELRSLRSLNLCACSNLTTLPNSIGELKSLVSLNLEGHVDLTALPNSIGELKSLVWLNLCRCSNLTSLPNSICEVKSLQTLDLRNCSNLTTLPDAIGELKSLTLLNLTACSNLATLPDSIGELKSLTSLNLTGCSNLTTLPDSIGELKSLTSLILTACSNLTTLPDSIGELKSLTSLNLGWCKNLETLPDSIGELKSLTSLNLTDCTNLTTLPDSIDELKSRISLNLTACENLKTPTAPQRYDSSNLVPLPDLIGDFDFDFSAFSIGN